MKTVKLFTFDRFFITIINDRFACCPRTDEVQFQDKVNIDKKVAIEGA